MKTFFNMSVLIGLVLLLLSCRTIQKATDSQLTAYQKTISVTDNIAEKQSQQTSQVKFTDMASVSSSDNGIERLIEEQIVEFTVPRKDSLLPDIAVDKVTRTTRKIRERGKQKELNIQQFVTQDSLRQLHSSQTDQRVQSDESAQHHQIRQRNMVRRTGVPWYVWAGSAVTVTFSFWFGKKIRNNRAAIRPWQNF